MFANTWSRYPRRQEFLWHELVDGKFQLLLPNTDGIFRSHFFPGLWLDPDVLWRIDHSRLSAVLQQGLATPEHAALVTRLAAGV